MFNQNMDELDERTFISKFEIKGNTFYVKIIWKPNEDDLLHMQLLNNDTSWSGKFSCDIAKKFQEDVDEDDALYETNVKEGLQNNNGRYIFDFVSVTNGNATFSWKKKFDGSTAVLTHGKVVLKQDKHNATKDTFIDTLLCKNNKLIQKIKTCKHENERLLVDLEKCKKELANFADMKISMESSLYSKFIQLLNVKKKRIQLLEDLLKNNERNQEN